MQSNDSPEWRTALAGSLREGDEVLVNGRKRPLTVTDRTTKDGSGGTYPHHHVWVEGNGTEYILVHYSIREHEPRLYSASEWFWRTYDEDHIEDELYFEKGAGEDILSLETTEERVVLSDTTAKEYIEPTVPETTWSEDYTPTEVCFDVDDHDPLGECPDCGGPVVKRKQMATCSDCPLWCPADEWGAYNVE